MSFGNHQKNIVQLSVTRLKKVHEVMAGNDKIKPNKYDIEDKKLKEKAEKEKVIKQGESK